MDGNAGDGVVSGMPAAATYPYPEILFARNGVATLSPDKYQLVQALQNEGLLADNPLTIFLYYPEGELDEQQQQLLCRILDGVEFAAQAAIRDWLCKQKPVCVLPRVATQSPWSSKAQEILQRCGLPQLRRIEQGMLWPLKTTHTDILLELQPWLSEMYDRMTMSVFPYLPAASEYFAFAASPTEVTRHRSLPLLHDGKAALYEACAELDIALTAVEIDWLLKQYQDLSRDPTDVELMMFAQANSEHCRHKIFNAPWLQAGKRCQETLFAMIKATHAAHPGQVLSAYHDNAAVMRTYPGSRFFATADDAIYRYVAEELNLLMKVETHNHPVAIAAFPGAATGAGGELRDEAATGRGAKPKAGLAGFAVSHLHLPALPQPWEFPLTRPQHIHSALEVMIDGPLGAAQYNNEFGRPCLAGFFRCFSQSTETFAYGYHKPVMLAGGYGMICSTHIDQCEVPVGAKIIVLGGAALRIGLGGGSSSSQASGVNDRELDFASVQRENAEMQRRCQELIDACCGRGTSNPILAIHDVGAGGLSNAVPELVAACGRGAILDIAAIPCADTTMTPLEIWCNESQERFVLVIAAESLPLFSRLCQRERAPFAVIGETTEEPQLVLQQKDAAEKEASSPVDIPLKLLFGDLPLAPRVLSSLETVAVASVEPSLPLAELIQRVLRFPSVGSKEFLLTIADRSVSGLVHRDQMVGPWQVPVADCAVTLAGYTDFTGEAMALGERFPLAVLDACAAARIAVAEALTNICAARILYLSDIVLSANWMAACGVAEEDAKLFTAVQAVRDMCLTLGICIPVGKDSLSMRTLWQAEDGQQKEVRSPLSLAISAFARVADIRKSLTPQLQPESDTCLLLLDLGGDKQRLGASVLHQVCKIIGGLPPDVDDVQMLLHWFSTVQMLNEAGLLLAYHDRSDGGLLATLCEMVFASHCGIDMVLPDCDTTATLFNEEVGAVLQVKEEYRAQIAQAVTDSGLPASALQVIGRPNSDQVFRIIADGDLLYQEDLFQMQQWWLENSIQIQQCRDNPECVAERVCSLHDSKDPGLQIKPSFTMPASGWYITTQARPKIAILREQGANGQVEMAAAFDRAGFDCVDINMQDLVAAEKDLSGCHGLAMVGGFSCGDVLGAGRGWAMGILHGSHLREVLTNFFHRQDTFALGVCNGCQTLSLLQELLPDRVHWPQFVANRSGRFESRLVMTEVLPSPSIFFAGMAGSYLPVVVAHAEGRVTTAEEMETEEQYPVLRYVDNYAAVTEQYPANPNGSAAGVTGFTSKDGRVTILMPHPERCFLQRQLSWVPADWRHEYTPWMQFFLNARLWLEAGNNRQ